MYRLITESLLGLQLEGDKLRFTPRPPKDWDSYTIYYRFHETRYQIVIKIEGEGKRIDRMTVDGHEQPEHFVTLQDDHAEHHVVIELR
jgi:cellobiose phosphorylase